MTQATTHTHSMTSHTPSTIPRSCQSTLSWFPAISHVLRDGTSILSPHTSFILSFPPKDQTLFSQTFSLYFETPRLIIKLYHTLGKYNSSSLWLLHFILLKSSIAYTDSITLILDSRKSSRHLQMFLSWTLPFSNIHLLKSHKVSSYPYILMFSQVFMGGGNTS